MAIKTTIGRIVFISVVTIISFSFLMYVIRTSIILIDNVTSSIPENVSVLPTIESFATTAKGWVESILLSPMAVAVLIALSLVVIALEARWR